MRSVISLVSVLIGVAVTDALAESAQTGAGQFGIGQEVYEQHCAACHAPSNIMVASPKLHNAAQWEPRLEADFDAVLDRAINGFKAMPAMGGCDVCSVEDIEAAIRYMAAPALSAPEASE